LQYKTSRKIAIRGGKQKFAALGLIHPIPFDCHGNAQAPGSESRTNSAARDCH
jgi:hypothetical protein